MPIGSSGRIVVEIDPTLKQALYDALRQEGFSLKDWFISQADCYLRSQQKQLNMFVEDQEIPMQEERAR